MLQFYVWSGVLAFVLNLWYLNWDMEEAWPAAIIAIVPGFNTLFAGATAFCLIDHYLFRTGR